MKVPMSPCNKGDLQKNDLGMSPIAAVKRPFQPTKGKRQIGIPKPKVYIACIMCVLSVMHACVCVCVHGSTYIFVFFMIDSTQFQHKHRSFGRTGSRCKRE